jgi:hypothetical protein
MSLTPPHLRPGDLVQVKSPNEILQTLDSDGALDRLPFMPEMLHFCGKRFRVARRVLKTCSYGTDSTMLAFNRQDVVVLDGVRCSGEDHDSCPKHCLIFWREAWLDKVEHDAYQPGPDLTDSTELRSRLKTKVGPTRYFCQAGELLNAAHVLSRKERFLTIVDDVRAGNCTALQMSRWIAIWLFWRIRRVFLGQFGKGPGKSTASHALNLQAGEIVEVKSMESITATLNEKARNRGLWFSPDQRLLCGKQCRVFRRLDKLIVDGTGEIRKLRNTVFLEGSMCSCAHVAFGGCPRNEYVYWREDWLRRPDKTN